MRLSLAPPNVPRFHEAKIDLHVLAFTTFAAVLAEYLFMYWPAWRISRRLNRSHLRCTNEAVEVGATVRAPNDACGPVW